MHTYQVEGFHLSPQQRYLWTSGQQQMIRITTQCEAALKGRLNVESLRAAIQATVARHEILKATFQRLPGMLIPLQQIEDSPVISLSVRDLTDLSKQEQKAECHLIAEAEADSPIDLRNGPVLRACLIACAPEENILLLTLPALCADRRSVENILREISFHYHQAGDDSLLDGAIQYSEAAAMLNQFAEADSLEPGKRFWSQQDINRYLDSQIPYQSNPALESSHAVKTVDIALPPSLIKELDAICLRLQVSRKTFLLSCWQILYMRLSGEPEFCGGVTFDGRVDDALSDAIGPYEKRLPFIALARPEMSVKEVARATKARIEELITWQDDFCWEQFNPDSEIQSPVAAFGWCFDYYSRLTPLVDGPLSFRITRLISRGERLKALLSIMESETELNAQLLYDAAILEPADAQRLSEQFQVLLADAIENTDAKLINLKVLPDGEKAFLIKGLNLTQKDYAIDYCTHHLFERQVRRSPEAIAAVFNDRQVSYAELDAKSNQLAWKLQKLGVGAEVKVALCLERSPEMLIGILGVFKASGAYVPLDPDHPSERLAYMIEDSQSRVLIAQKGMELNFQQVKIPAIYLDSDASEIKAERTDRCSSAVSPSNLAYVIYTSGSTGKPKGVAIEHRQLVNYILASRERIGLGAHRFALLSTVAADLGNTALFGALCGGGSLHLIPQDVALDGKRLADYFKRHPIDCVKITSSHLAGLLIAGEAADILPDLRLVLGGETSDRAWAEKLQQFKPDCSFFNHYGPTETTIGCCMHAMPESQSRSGSVPIGKPISNLQLYVLDEVGQPVPLKVNGELYIGGAGVGRGYFDKPGLTAERYVPDEYSGRAGSRVYRSGDVVRWSWEGELEYVGRRDSQVKIRGNRVELEEVESVLRGCRGVEQGAVVVEGEGLEARLVGYVVVGGGGGGEEERRKRKRELEEEMRRKLPRALVPVVYEEVERLPLLGNGKIDRKRLREKGVEKRERQAGVKARTVVEEVLVGIWEEVLEVEGIGVREEFFELGGHSLLATQVISRIREVLKVEMPLRILFEATTVEHLAEEVERARQAGASHQPAIKAVKRDPLQELPLSYAQQRLWFIDQLEPGSNAYNVPTVVRLRGPLDVNALRRSLNRLIARHEVLRTSFHQRDGEPYQMVQPPYELDLPVRDFSDRPLAAAESAARRLAEQEIATGFDLGQGRLVRGQVARLAEQEHVLVVVMHHIVSDGWSVGILIREVSRLYAGYAGGEEVELAELAVQYGDYAVWQRAYLRGAALEEQMGYWRQELAGVQELRLPTDRPRPAVASHAGGRVMFAWDGELTRKLKRLARAEGATLYMVLQAGFQVLLSRYSGQRDIAIGTDVASRNRQEIEGVIGFFINQLVMRSRVESEASFRELLGQVRERTLGAYEHQEVPFEKVVDELVKARDMSRAPLFQVKLVLQNTRQEELRLGAVRLEAFAAEFNKIKVDLNLMLEERDGCLRGVLNYATELYERERAEAMVEHLRVLLEGAVARPAAQLRELLMLSAQERRQVIKGWNQTAKEYGEARCVQEMFEAAAAQHPERVAVVYEGQKVSYGELNVRANQLGHYLRGLGVGPEVRVGLCMERGIELMVGLLAIMKAGGAYVPMEAGHPAERLGYMLEDAGVAVVVTEAKVAQGLPTHWGQVISVDEEREEIGRQRRENPALLNWEANLLYVIYTSGTTGKPKGVGVEHRQMRHYVESIVERLGLRAGMKMSLVSSIATDLGHTVIYPALSQGGELHIISEARGSDGREMSRYNREAGIECLKITPTQMVALLKGEEEEEWVMPEKVLVIGGEASRSEWVKRMQERRPGCRIENHYGPTECTVGVITKRVSGEEAQERVGLGKPLSNVEAYVVDESGEVVGIGMEGELWIGGRGVTRGYMGKARETAEKYVPDEYSGRAGSRVYRSGDVVRWSWEGELEYVGRRDSQVKIRGNRVELEEVESVLRGCRGVEQGAVVVEGEGLEARLVGYVVVGGGGGGEEERRKRKRELEEEMRRKLPRALVPVVYEEVERLPLLGNGKIDRKRLREKGVEKRERQAGVKARTVVEEVLVGIWEEVLEVEGIGVREEFFELGGHSLLATQVISRIREVLKVEVPLRILFEATTVEQLAQAIPEFEPIQGQAEKVATILKKVKLMSAESVS